MLDPAATPVARSISACQRCRSRKTRCDLNFPCCNSCSKAKVECVIVDAATGREVPRVYVLQLEERIKSLEAQLEELELAGNSHSPSCDAFSTESATSTLSPTHGGPHSHSNPANVTQFLRTPTPSCTQRSTPQCGRSESFAGSGTQNSNEFKLGLNVISSSSSIPTLPGNVPDNIMSPVGVSLTSPGSFMGLSSGSSFAELLILAVKYSSKHTVNSAYSTLKINNSLYSSSISGDFLKGKVEPANLPDKKTAEKLLSLFFAQSNSQLPVLHRESFLEDYFIPVYGYLSPDVSLASDYDINVKQKSYHPDNNSHFKDENFIPAEPEKPSKEYYFLFLIFGIATTVHHLHFPADISERYRLAAMIHLQPVLSSTNKLETLQGILLFALYALMRPAPPGVWNILSSALRLCVDLGLHTEGHKHNKVDRHDREENESNSQNTPNKSHKRTKKSEKEAYIPLSRQHDGFTLDMRRRLFWCTYTLDRQICMYLGRPFGIPEESINVPFPSSLDDSFIVRNDSSLRDYSLVLPTTPTYKTISLTFIQLRKIQAEIQQILYDGVEVPRCYDDMVSWKVSIEQRLEDWRRDCPRSKKKMNCDFNLAFIDLNYYHTKLILYGLNSLQTYIDERSLILIADAGVKMIMCFKGLHGLKAINYTWAAVRNMFMAGTSYLYALYHTKKVRERTTLAEYDKYTASCLEVLTSMLDRCDAAGDCIRILSILFQTLRILVFQTSSSNDVKVTLNDKVLTRNTEGPQSLSSQGDEGYQQLPRLANKLHDGASIFDDTYATFPVEQYQNFRFTDSPLSIQPKNVAPPNPETHFSLRYSNTLNDTSVFNSVNNFSQSGVAQVADTNYTDCNSAKTTTEINTDSTHLLDNLINETMPGFFDHSTGNMATETDAFQFINEFQIGRIWDQFFDPATERNNHFHMTPNFNFSANALSSDLSNTNACFAHDILKTEQGYIEPSL
ncbi:hypothetical protein NADFUDRAFT_84312 [Nadsonia fulvescens var. elongata DSM 6958]|uniref:Zn(2)-C6 fungal-type domain-containing protein n=1 Tax=Nadsonia fulvescens var. elongata DSM 6958 TaxID=857566 RepID=A0A1E3PE37_9ASCO|nr:hypothetical protein NADFUDRAFT_84312 [Nadsonia fulvescens var. elongata DSM 6958]